MAVGPAPPGRWLSLLWHLSGWSHRFAILVLSAVLLSGSAALMAAFAVGHAMGRCRTEPGNKWPLSRRYGLGHSASIPHAAAARSRLVPRFASTLAINRERSEKIGALERGFFSPSRSLIIVVLHPRSKEDDRA